TGLSCHYCGSIASGSPYLIIRLHVAPQVFVQSSGTLGASARTGLLGSYALDSSPLLSP
ncbi:hypothetical protein SK128_025300, partial [Halocaridina rubra]